MIATLRRNPLLLGLAVLAALLAVVLALELRLAMPAGRDAAPRGARPVEAKLLPPIAARPPEQAYPEVTTRPLFVSTRRPAPEMVAATSAPTMVRGKFVLHGVIAHGQQRTAMLRERSSGRVHRVEAGGEVDGMKVVAIDKEAVTLGLGEEREVVPLMVQKAGGPTIAAGPGQPGMLPGGGGAPMAPAGAGPFARSAAALPSPPEGAAAATRAATAPQPVATTPNQPATPGFGPQANIQPPAGSSGAPPVQGQPAGSAFPMSPEELLARRRARRAQQNQ